MDTDRIPDGWYEESDPEFIDRKYDPRPVTVFRHVDHGATLVAMPSEPNTEHTETDTYRLAVAREETSNFGDVEPFAEVHGDDEALAAAGTFTRAYNAEGGGDAGIEAGKRAVADERERNSE
ncbi:hypothetical protein [Haloprofundus salinisoli]|uniref:hypothetical protein n=1 Tax=Haloprofundus salinisoli TaxID=2876193 RepID=UPI001CCA4B82|nr:hypothetical protein [Haloprofundus salinisoli]